ncbi:MAG: hypothetical protein U0487_01955 [Patescibacteria group bacterium]
MSSSRRSFVSPIEMAYHHHDRRTKITAFARVIHDIARREHQPHHKEVGMADSQIREIPKNDEDTETFSVTDIAKRLAEAGEIKDALELRRKSSRPPAGPLFNT